MIKHIIISLKANKKRFAIKFKHYLNRQKKVQYLSFGENCLTDDILKRYHLKTFSSPYSSARSNIEYILQIEKDHFNHFVDTDFIKYENINGRNTPRLTAYNKIENTYHKTCMNGFEFTHHDIIGDINAKKAMIRRCKRMLHLKRKKVCIFYHHRYCEETDKKMLIKHLRELRDLYIDRGCDTHIFMFTQKLVSSEEERKIECEIVDEIRLYTLFTLNIWGGNNEEFLWARCDEDLLRIMIQDIKK